jgi:pyruvate dehydrogenase E2 component (dihydrolipoamide acetyltransferase)
MNDWLIRILAHALAEHPFMNASLQEGQILHYSTVNIGLAVETAAGLRVPVIRNCQEKSLTAICADRRECVQRARDGRLSATDERGGTFTLSSLAHTAVTHFTPIIRMPEAAILGVGRTEELPPGAAASTSAQRVMPLSLSFDHRLVDGAPAATFLTRLQALLEEPFHILL